MSTMTLLQAVDDGRLCGHCGADIRINIPAEDTAEMNKACPDCGDSATPGVRGLCTPCSDAGEDPNDYQE